MNFLVNMYVHMYVGTYVLRSIGAGLNACMCVHALFTLQSDVNPLLLFCRAVLLSLHLVYRYLFCSKCFLEMPGETVSIGEDGYTPT